MGSAVGRFASSGTVYTAWLGLGREQGAGSGQNCFAPSDYK